MTLKEIYQNYLVETKRKAPSEIFVQELATLTLKSEAAVRRWLCNGRSYSIPDALTQEVLAKHFNTTPEELFPNK